MPAAGHIFLCGFMGCGKSTHGKKIAALLKYSFIDLDKYIQEKENKTIQFIFEHEGESEFRKLETHYLKQIIHAETRIVIALGGGTVCFNDNLSLIKNSGILVYIKMSPRALSERLLKSKQERPLLKNISPDNLPAFIENKLKEREPFYTQAELVADGVNLNYLQLHQSLLDQKN